MLLILGMKAAYRTCNVIPNSKNTFKFISHAPKIRTCAWPRSPNRAHTLFLIFFVSCRAECLEQVWLIPFGDTEQWGNWIILHCGKHWYGILLFDLQFEGLGSFCSRDFWINWRLQIVSRWRSSSRFTWLILVWFYLLAFLYRVSRIHN
jgi:hypothetical protein